MKLGVNREPVMWGGLINIIPGVLLLLGVQTSSEELTNIFGAIMVLIPAITALIARNKVVPVQKIEEQAPQAMAQMKVADRKAEDVKDAQE